MASGDFSAFPPPEQLPNSFTLARSRQCFEVTIMDDTIPEPEQQFTVMLNLVARTNFPRVRVDPDLATIIIEDNDSK